MSQQQTAPVHHENHGSTPAAWTTVVIITIAFVIGTLAVILGNWPLFWGAVALVVVGAVVGKVMAMMGMGKKKA
jgi:membrane protein YdbS with pleckstrin-like domain